MTAAVFDLGGVLVEWNATRLFRAVLGDDDAVAHFMQDVDFVAWNHGLDRGLPFAATVATFRAEHPQWDNVIDTFGQRWNECIGPIYEPATALVDELRSTGVPCYGLSNSSTETLARNPLTTDVFAHLDGVLLSGEIGVCKPEPEIYAEAERRFGLDPANTWFTDDNEANVAAAVAQGWKGHVCTDPSRLRDAAVAAGLLDA